MLTGNCCIDMPAMAAAVEAAPLTEYAENISVSKPLFFRICFIHLAILHGRTKRAVGFLQQGLFRMKRLCSPEMGHDQWHTDSSTSNYLLT